MSWFLSEQFQEIHNLFCELFSMGTPSFAAQEASETATDVLTPLSESNSALSAVLEEETVLRKILGYLTDDGLPQCRRVCRKWRRVCNQLPVKLYRVEQGQLEEIHERFPQASSISLYHEVHDLPASQEAIEHLGTLPFLGELTMSHGLFCPGFASPVTSLAPLITLTSLELVAACQPLVDLRNSLRHLVHLTRLKVEGKVRSTNLIEPFFELIYIRELGVPDLLFMRTDGILLFPSLTELTRLEIICFSRATTQSSLQTASFYSESVVELSVSFKIPGEDLSRDLISWSMLNMFTTLKSLQWKKGTENETGFFEVLENLTGLTKLSLVGSGFSIPLRSVPAKAIFSLKALRFIEIANLKHGEGDQALYPFSNLMQLTKLVAVGFIFKDSLRTLTNLVHLQSSYSIEPTRSLFQSLVHLPKLGTLKVDWIQKGFVRGNIFSKLTSLSSLFMKFYDVPDKTFLPALASLPKLKSLSLLYHPEDDIGDFLASMLHISRLSGLTRLGLLFDSEWNQLEVFPEGSFPRLQRLEFPITRYPNHIGELKSRFPSVVQIHRSRFGRTES